MVSQTPPAFPPSTQRACNAATRARREVCSTGRKVPVGLLRSPCPIASSGVCAPRPSPPAAADATSALHRWVPAFHPKQQGLAWASTCPQPRPAPTPLQGPLSATGLHPATPSRRAPPVAPCLPLLQRFHLKVRRRRHQFGSLPARPTPATPNRHVLIAPARPHLGTRPEPGAIITTALEREPWRAAHQGDAPGVRHQPLAPSARAAPARELHPDDRLEARPPGAHGPTPRCGAASSGRASRREGIALERPERSPSAGTSSGRSATDNAAAFRGRAHRRTHHRHPYDNALMKRGSGAAGRNGGPLAGGSVDEVLSPWSAGHPLAHLGASV